MAIFTTAADFGSSVSRLPRVRVAQFGDGYEQRAADGINTQPKAWQLSFNARTNAEASTIIAFFEARAGVEAFDWTDPDGFAGKWICRAWQKSLRAYGVNDISATFEQVYE